MVEDHDRFRLVEWAALPPGCAVAGCEELWAHDERGPLFLRDGTMHRLCQDHWEAVMGVTGRQGAWEADAHRTNGLVPDPLFTGPDRTDDGPEQDPDSLGAWLDAAPEDRAAMSLRWFRASNPRPPGASWASQGHGPGSTETVRVRQDLL